MLRVLQHATLNYQHEVIKIGNQNADSHPKCNSIRLGSKQWHFVASYCVAKCNRKHMIYKKKKKNCGTIRQAIACGVAGC